VWRPEAIITQDIARMNEDNSQTGKPEERDGIQGEGDYEAARRFDKASAEFVKSHDVEGLARSAAPRSPAEEQSMREAEEQGRSHSHGEDEKDDSRTEDGHTGPA